jgi:tetratricopeptide (TPR) repeat protein
MRTLAQAILLVTIALWAWPLPAQEGQSCSNFSIVIESPEDKLMLAVNGTDDPNAKIAALEKFLQEHPDSSYAPCVDESLTKNYVRLKQYDQAIAAGKKALAANRLDVPFLEDLLQAYMGSGNARGEAFDLIIKAAKPIGDENNPTTSVNESAEQIAQARERASQQATSDTDYMVYAFLNLSRQITDPQERIKALDRFSRAYPDAVKERASEFDYRYAMAYAQSNQPAKADEYTEKAIAVDPNNVDALNMAAYEYALRVPAKRATAAVYAQKVVTLLPTLKKPQGVPEDQFKVQQNTQAGMAHLTLGYLDLVKQANSHRVEGAIREFEEAAELLTADPELQGQAYYFLGFSYESLYPADHRKALAALERAVQLRSSTQARARELLVKVRQVVH